MGQQLAHQVFSDETLSKVYFRLVMKERLHLDAPQTFNEKLQWLKLYYYPRQPLAVQCADKYAVRDYVAQKGLKELLVPLLGCWESPAFIPWETLPEQFVLKCNHGCAYNIVCRDKAAFDRRAAAKQLGRWQKEDFGAFNIEPHYSQIISRKILCEQYLGEKLVDFKFFCFHGVPQYAYVSRDLLHDRSAQIGFYTLDGQKMPLRRGDYEDISDFVWPECYDEMLVAARVLCRDFPFVRVDFFLAGHRYYFAELTFTPGACMMPFEPKEYDQAWGRLLDLGKAVGANGA
jgi:hypothetical protein